LISASNELPEKDKGLEALWDRFLVRLVVKGIEDEEKFNAMISMPYVPYAANEDTITNQITSDEYEKWSTEIDKIEVPGNIFKVIDVIRKYIDGQIYISDRRWRKIMRLLKTSAFLNDRTEVDLVDCILIKYCIWNEESQQEKVDTFIKEAIEKHGYTFKLDFSGTREEIDELKIDIKKETENVKDDRVEVLVNTRDKYYEIKGLDKKDYYTDNKSTPLLLLQSDYDSLATTDSREYLYYYRTSYGSISNENSHNLRKGKNKFHVIIDDKEYKLKTKIDGSKIKKTRKPHKSVEEAWDKQVSNLLETIDKWKSNIDDYRSKDLEHIRTNIFVNPELAVIVEKSILDTSKTINDYESEIKQVRKSYKDIIDKEEIIP